MEADLSQRVHQADLTRGQRLIADYVLRNQNRICSMTCITLAREIGVSDASIIRFARAIGYQGFSDLKADLYLSLTSDLARSDVGAYPVDKRLNILSGKYGELDMEKELPKLLIGNVEQSIRQTPSQTYQKAVEILHQSRKKYVIGLRGGKGAAVYFGRLLSYLMDDVQVITSGEEDSVAQLQGLRKEDVVIAISYARYYKIDMLIARLIEQQGAALCALVDSMNSPLARAAGTVFLVETKHIGFSNSTVGTIAVLEYLLNMLCWKYPGQYQKRLTEREELLKDFHL